MEVELWLAIVLGLVPLVGWLLWWWNDIWYRLVTTSLRSSECGSNRLPPGHMGLPIIGEMLTLLWYFKIVHRPDDYINSKRIKYGDEIGLYRTHLFGKPSVIAFLPTTTKFVFREHETFRMEWANVELVGETSMLAIHGSEHLRLRSFVSRCLNQPEALRRAALAVQPRIISSLQTWAECGQVISYKEVKKITFENVGMYFASIQPGTTLNRLEKDFAGLINGFRSYRLNIPGTAFYRSIQCRRNVIMTLNEELTKRKNNHDESGRPVKDLLDDLMNLEDEEGNRLSDIQILDNIASFLVAGHESTVIAITWAIYHLAKSPDVLQKLRDENMSLRKSKNEQLVTSDEVLKLKYTTKVVDETIRIANVAAFLFRRATKDVNYKGYIIPSGWNVILWVRYLHTDAENFDNPLCFNPDRWDASTTPGSYHPFGGGSRLCAGNMFARLQLFLFLHHFSTGYKWKLMNPDAKVTYLPNPLPVDHVEITIEKL